MVSYGACAAFGGITAGVVALPLALAFGEASGAGPIAGMWGAIFVGFFAALFGGTGSQVSGPTGPMVVVFAGVFASLSGNPALVFAADSMAWLLNIRSKDILYTPVAVSYVVVTDKRCTLYVDPRKVTKAAARALKGRARIKAYDEVWDDLADRPHACELLLDQNL